MARCTACVKKVDVLVNNAGVGGGEIVQGSDVARWKRTIDTNLTGMYLVTRQILPLMAEQRPHHQLVVGARPLRCSRLHRVLRIETWRDRIHARARAGNVKKKITVNAIAPGWVDTDMAVQGMTQGATHAKVSFDEFKDRRSPPCRSSASSIPLKSRGW